jgi:hypothetical protein
MEVISGSKRSRETIKVIHVFYNKISGFSSLLELTLETMFGLVCSHIWAVWVYSFSPLSSNSCWNNIVKQTINGSYVTVINFRPPRCATVH